MWLCLYVNENYFSRQTFVVFAEPNRSISMALHTKIPCKILCDSQIEILALHTQTTNVYAYIYILLIHQK